MKEGKRSSTEEERLTSRMRGLRMQEVRNRGRGKEEATKFIRTEVGAR